LGGDPDATVRLRALEALAEPSGERDPDRLRQVLATNFGHRDKRVRQAAARLALKLPPPAWETLHAGLTTASPPAPPSAILASAWRRPEPEIHEAVVSDAIDVLRVAEDPGDRLQAVRLIILGLGDYHLVDPPVEVYTAYSTPYSLRGHEALVEQIGQAVHAV